MREQTFTMANGRKVIIRGAADRRLAKRLGVTHAGLEMLARAVASKTGAVMGAPTTRGALLRLGLIDHIAAEYRYQINDRGRAIVREARAAGW